MELVPVGVVESELTDRASAPRQGDEGAPEAWLAFEERVKMHGLLMEGLDRVFRDRGLPGLDELGARERDGEG